MPRPCLTDLTSTDYGERLIYAALHAYSVHVDAACCRSCVSPARTDGPVEMPYQMNHVLDEGSRPSAGVALLGTC